MKFLRSLSVHRWSERSIILLVMQSRDNSIALRRNKRLGVLVTRPGHGEPNPTYLPVANDAAREVAEMLDGEPWGAWNETLLDAPTTAHILGGCVVGDSPETGVIDAYHRVYGYEGLTVSDGSAVSANLGVNPSLSITALTERAMSMWPNNGDADPRPAVGAPYRAARAGPPEGAGGARGCTGRAPGREPDMTADVLLAAAGAIAVLMVVTWLISLAVKDASIVDIIWGFGFVVVALAAAVVGDGFADRRWILLCLVGVWGLRLTGYLAWRNLGHGEDSRYVAMRRKWGDRFWWVSFFQVFLLQGVLMWIVSLPVQLSATAAEPASFGPLAYLGAAVWTVGLPVRDHRRRPARPVQGRPGQQGPGDGPRPVALHPPPQLLRRLLRVVGHLPDRRRDRSRAAGASSARSSCPSC